MLIICLVLIVGITLKFETSSGIAELQNYLDSFSKEIAGSVNQKVPVKGAQVSNVTSEARDVGCCIQGSIASRTSLAPNSLLEQMNQRAVTSASVVSSSISTQNLIANLRNTVADERSSGGGTVGCGVEPRPATFAVTVPVTQDCMMPVNSEISVYCVDQGLNQSTADSSKGSGQTKMVEALSPVIIEGTTNMDSIRVVHNFAPNSEFCLSQNVMDNKLESIRLVTAVDVNQTQGHSGLNGQLGVEPVSVIQHSTDPTYMMVQTLSVQLIPLSQSDGSSLQPGNTVLLPIVPTLLPDGNIEMHIAGTAVRIPAVSAQSQQPHHSTMLVLNSAGDLTTATNVSVINESAGKGPTLTPLLPTEQKAVGSYTFTVTSNNDDKTSQFCTKASDGAFSKSGDAKTDNNMVINLWNDSGSMSEEFSKSNVGDGLKHDMESVTTTVPIKMISSIESGEQVNVFRCEYCDYTNPKRYLIVRHMKSHSEDRPHKCTVCERSFKTSSSLQNHVNTHTGLRPHHCTMCSLAFTTSGELVRHMRYRHTMEKPHKCPDCSYASVELSKLKRHIRSHTGERPYPCPRCTYASPDTYKLKRHLRVHTGEKPYQCDTCLQRFTQSNSLKAHKLIHTNSKPVYHCEFCPSSCGRKTDLRIHIEKLHTSEVPIPCAKCSRLFPDRYSYKMHQKTHDGEKCFQCEVCSYSSYSQRHLDIHLMMHRGEKPFKCPECNQAFRQQSLLKRHRNLKHNPQYTPPAKTEMRYSCDQCSKRFRFQGNFNRHLENHRRAMLGLLPLNARTRSANKEDESVPN